MAEEPKLPAPPAIPDHVIVEGYARRVRTLIDEMIFLMQEASKDDIAIHYNITYQADCADPKLTFLHLYKRYKA